MIAKPSAYVALNCFLALLASTSAAQQSKPCTSAEADHAIDESDRLKSWNEAYQFFKRYEHCDDGAVAEGYSDSVTRLLAKDWRRLEALNNLVSKDVAFRNFVLRHIDSTASSDNLKEIAENSRLRCPPKLRSLCRSIGAKAREALKELEDLGLVNRLAVDQTKQ